MLLVMTEGAKTKDEFQRWILSRFVEYAQFLWSWIVSVAYFACLILFDIGFDYIISVSFVFGFLLDASSGPSVFRPDAPKLGFIDKSHDVKTCLLQVMPLISNDFDDETARSSKRFEAVGRFSKRQTCMAFFSIFFSESNSEVPGSEMASHLELRETETPDVHTVDDVDGKHLEQSFRELKVTKELY